MSWSFNVRVLGLSVVLAAVGCGGNPDLINDDPGVNGGSSAGKPSNTSGTGGSLNIGGTENGTGGDEPTPTYVCGNQELEPGEFCDDGNTDDGDGCSGDCSEVDLDYDCSTVGEPCVKVVICGNGVLEGEETCDDLNETDGDGCSADCGTVEDGWVCVRPGKDCVKLSVCGNGARERGEACDDGQTPPEAGDGCDELCQIEDTYYCPLPGQACVQQVCGDTVRTPNEACDDGNQAAGDGCNATCTMVEAGWHCNSMGCKPSCGDGLVRGTEQCDDGNASGGDGCSGGCKTEPLWSCNGASPSVCGPELTAEEACGNGKLDPIFTQSMGKWQITAWEVCDPPNEDRCNADCTKIEPEVVEPIKCGNGVLEAGEECDKPAADPGCSAACKEEPGYTCPSTGPCKLRCGDGTVDFALGEGCDPPRVNQGCSATCKVENGWACTGLTNSVCVRPVCGNSVIETGEQCDDGSAAGSQDGCFGCAINPDYVCPAAGQSCQPRCGDGKKVGSEQCDDGNKASDDGCNAGCKVEPGFTCPSQNTPCQPAVCGNGDVDSGEGCDDSNTIAGDGCSATCQPEPVVTVGPNPTVDVFCGDGLVTGGEVCDDGNADAGDGCDDECDIEAGWACEDETRLPSALSMRVTYRDFKKRTSSGGHSDFEQNPYSEAGSVPGPVCTRTTTECTVLPGVVCPAGTCGHLDTQGKPAFHRNDGTASVTNEDTFSLWYRNTNPTNIAGPNGPIQISPLVSSLTLSQFGGASSDVYVYDNETYPEYANKSFFPLTGLGFGNDGNSRNYHFTTELRYFFQYKGGETLTFRGDDDVWAFINGRHAVDIGGVHGVQYGRVVLGDDGGTGATDSNCSAHRSGSAPGNCTLQANEVSSDDDVRFGLTKGGVYEIVLFHAERHTSESNFRLTLAGFLAPRSFCEPECGDGVIVGDEFCDDGDNNSDTVAGACKTDCTARNFCGDGVRQLPGEACDNGVNTDLYKTASSPATACAPGCKVPASCGDGALQAGFGEKCDNGASNNNSSYGPNSCKTNCTLGGYCGDDVVNGNELCDTGPDNGKGYGPDSCTSSCTPGPHCGDGVLAKGWEACDKGAANGTPGALCTVSCTIPPYCGDGIKQNNEECDFGQFASTEYGGCTDMCLWGPKCGDGEPDTAPDPEECDDGAGNDPDAYNGCTDKCALGPRCGDGVLQSSEGEACDNGFNADDYNDPKTPAAECGMNCTAPPFCGDGVLQSAYEFCDNGVLEDDGTCSDPPCNYPADSIDAYDGCTTLCEFGAYCGDGAVQDGKEVCDDGVENVPYSPEMGGCGYDCQLAPYCGDGERNGPEQCDLGMADNTGEYGTCNEDCTFAPYCGDRTKNGNEECDDGLAGSLTCTPTCKRRMQVQ